MKNQLLKIRTNLEALLSRAEEFSESDNEAIAQKYADMPDLIDSAISAVNDAYESLA